MQIQLKERTKQLAVSVIKLSAQVQRNDASAVIIRQVLKSGTSVGANYRSALRGKSKADFIMKLKIALEEADETVYWLELLKDSDLASASIVEPVLHEANQLTAILTASVKTAKVNQQNF
jgi:four helix bundle protein